MTYREWKSIAITIYRYSRHDLPSDQHRQNPFGGLLSTIDKRQIANLVGEMADNATLL